MVHEHIFFPYSFFIPSPLDGFWLPPNQIWNKIIMLSDRLLWGFPVSSFSGSRACRAVIYQRSALSDLMYSHILKSKMNGKTPSKGDGQVTRQPHLGWELALRWMNRACSVKGADFRNPGGCRWTCCCVRTLNTMPHPLQKGFTVWWIVRQRC